MLVEETALVNISTGKPTFDGRKYTSVRSQSLPLVLGVLWLFGMTLGLVALGIYGNTPGRPAAEFVESSWPAASKLPRRSGHKNLVIFAHPRCPCTRATLEELHRILARSRRIPDTHIVFMDGSDRGAPLWHSAAAIPGVQIVNNGGTEARAFQAFTSGQTFLFDEAGKLRFAGGITGARGHVGDNSGASAVLSILNGDSSARERSFVFGCALSASPGAIQ